MGKSRSATILLAYLLWSSRQRAGPVPSPRPSADDPDMIELPTQPLSVIKALELLRQGRPIAEPNEGFMDQLHMYEDMGCPSTEAELTKHKIYRRWMNKRSVEESLRVNMAPEMAAIKFEDEADDDNDDDTESLSQGAIKDKTIHPVAPGIKAPDGTTSSQPTPSTTLKCRKCRHSLATSPFMLTHHPPPHADPSVTPAQCAHHFLHPLSWMRPVLSEGQMEGRLSCPKCATNIGKFAWSGLRCSCGGWVTPGFGVTRGKVDEVVTSSGGSAGVRMPPRMRRGGNL